MVDPGAFFAEEEIEQALVYHRPLYLFVPVRVALELGILAAAAFSPFGRALADMLDGLPWWGQTVMLTAILIGLTAVATVPIALWTGFVREHSWGFSTQTLMGFLVDRAKGLAIGLVLGCASVLGLVGLARMLPGGWPLAAGGGAAALVVLLGFFAPLLLEPLFNRFTPLADEELAVSLRQLSAEAGVPVQQVLVADASRRTTKQNAYVSGLGRTRRLVVYDTLLADAGRPELRLVLAHELGHRRLGHLAKGTALAAAGATAYVAVLWALLEWPSLRNALDVSGAGDPRVAAFALLLGACLQLVTAPAGAAVSRRWERQADQISLELTHDINTFERTHRKLALANLSDLDPPRLAYLALFTHPTPPERIAAAHARNRTPESPE